VAFQPEINQELTIEGVGYSIAEHPAARGMPYGQEGRQAVVYQLAVGPGKRAIKVFKPRFRVPGLVSGARRLGPYAELPGLEVCRRVVLTPQAEPELLRRHPDLLYAVLMPWIEGPTWMEVLGEKEVWSPEQSLDMARAFAGILASMEQEGLAHCDLSAPNVLLPALAPNFAEHASSPVALVDVEQMYGPDLRRPDVLPGGSSGYAHKTAPEGLWAADADRFAGAVILAEMLGWCDERVRKASWGENYFSPDELQAEGDRYRVLLSVLRERWGAGITQLFERAWHSEWLPECSTFGEWLVMLPAQVPDMASATPEAVPQAETTPQGAPGTTSELSQAAARALMDTAGRLEAQGNVSGALDAYKQALASVPHYSSLGQELMLIVRDLEASGAVRTSDSTTLLPDMLSAPLQEGTVHQEAADDAETAALFDDGYAAYQSGDLLSARELMEEIARRDPSYTRNGQTATVILGEIDRKLKGAAPDTNVGADTAALTTPNIIEPRAEPEAVQVVTLTPPPDVEQHVSTPPQATEVLTTPAMPATTYVVSKRPRPRLALVIVPAIVLLALVLFGGMAVFQAQQASQAQATATAQAMEIANATGTAESEQANATAQIIAAATEQAFATETEIAAQATGTVIAEATAIELDLQAATTRQAQAGETRQAQQIATSEAQSAGTALAIRADLTAAPRPPAVSAENAERLAVIRKLRGHWGHVSAIAISPDGRLLASASQDKKIRIWNLADGALIRTLERHTEYVVGLAFSPDGQTLASTSWDGVRVWGTSDGVEIRNLTEHEYIVERVAFSPDGLLMATASGDKTARIWRAAEGKSLFVLGGAQGHKDYLTDVAFSPDGQTVATSSADGTVRLWNVGDGKTRLVLTGPAGKVHNVAFSPDGTIVAAGAEDYKLYVWSAADGAPIRTLEGFEAPPGSIAFTPDGQFLAVAASWGGKIHLGRVKDGALLRTLEGHDGSITALAFTPDGTILVSGSSDDSVLLWGIPQAGQAPTPGPIEAAIGGSGEINGVKVTLNNLRYSEEGETDSEGKTYEVGEGYQFLITDLTLENTGTEPRPVYVPGEFKVLDEYRNSRDLSLHGKLSESLVENAGDTLAPGAKVTGEISFEMEKDVKGLTLVYGPMTAPGEIVFKLDR
jgi:WD40 repeat protein